MRFTQLTIGEHFEYQNVRYTKNGPLTAVNLETNQRRMIPRSALVAPLSGAAVSAEQTPPETLDAKTLAAAFEEYHQECLQWLQQNDKSTRELREKLEQARLQFLARCGIG